VDCDYSFYYYLRILSGVSRVQTVSIIAVDSLIIIALFSLFFVDTISEDPDSVSESG
jgi:hypothetical protein